MNSAGKVKAQDALLGINHNEINIYNPQIQAVVAKVDTIEEIPEEFLKFARENEKKIGETEGKKKLYGEKLG